MKRIALLSILILGVFLAGCKTQQKTAGISNDDVYNQSAAVKDYSKPSGTTPEYINTTDENTGNQPKSAVSKDDNSDYSYSARVKRFHNPEQGAGYYDPVYTDPANYDTTATEEQAGASSSGEPDVNIYLGSGWGSCYSPYSSFGFSYGWGYDPWYWGYYGYPYSYWYSPSFWWDPFYFGYYYPYYYPYYSYGYWNGYWNGYWDGYYGYPYGWYDYGGDGRGQGTYYGRRTTIGGGGFGNYRKDYASEFKRSMPDNTLATRSEPGVKTGTASRSTSAVRTTPNPQQQYRYTRPSSEKQTPAVQRQNVTTERQGTQTTPKYVRPEVRQNNVPATRSNTQNYSSPAYRQPKSSQEYLSPRTQPSGTVRPQGQGTTQPRQVSPTTPSNRNYSAPQQQRVTPGNTQPRNTTPSYSSPQRNTTPTQRSNSSYSTPSRSNSSSPSYSSPSRSGSGSGSSYSTPSRSSSGGSSYSSPSGSGGGSSSSRSSGSSSGGGFSGHRK